MKKTSKPFAVAAAFGFICLAPAALAQTPAAGSTELPTTHVNSAGLPSTTVSYADLDVGSEAGMRTLTTRIRNAVRRVCWQSIEVLGLEEVYVCRNQSRRDAWQQFERNQERAQAARGPMVAAIAIRSDVY